MLSQLTATLLLAALAASKGFPVVVQNLNLDSEYELEFQVGTPPQTLRVNLDSTSPRLTIYAGSQDPSAPVYRSQQSKTFQVMKEISSTLKWATDKVALGNDSIYLDPHDNDGTWPAYRPHAGSIEGYEENYDYHFILDASDALTSASATWGFALESLAGSNLTLSLPRFRAPFWHEVSRRWTEDVVGLYLSRHIDEIYTGINLSDLDRLTSTRWNDSELMLGGVNKSKITGDIKYYSFSAVDYAGWPVPLENVTVNGVMIDMSHQRVKSYFGEADFTVYNRSIHEGSGPEVRSMVMTSSPYIYAPREVVHRLYEIIPEARRVNDHDSTAYWIPCNTSTSAIDIRLTIGGDEYLIRASDIIGPLDQLEDMLCLGTIRSWDNLEWGLGTAFLKNVYTSFRLASPAVGLGRLVEQPIKLRGLKADNSALCFGVSRILIAVAAIAALLL